MATATLAGCAAWFVGDDPAARRALASEYLTTALAELAAGDVDTARAQLIDAVEIAPDHAEARNALGVLLLAEGRVDDAIVQFQWAVQGDDVAAFQYHMALAYMAQGSVGFATPYLNRALEIDPNFVPAKRTLLSAYLMLGRWDRAERLLVELRRDQKGSDPSLDYAEGLVAFAKEDFATAQTKLGAAFRTMPDAFAPAAAMGLLYESLGFFDKAESAYKLALKRDLDDPYLNLVMADFYMKTGRYLLAEAYLKRTAKRPTAAAKLPAAELALANFQIADAAFQMAKYRSSEIYKAHAARIDGQYEDMKVRADAAAHFANGLVEFERRNVDAAVREFKVAISGDAKFTLAWLRLAEALLLKAALSPLEEREKTLEQAVKASDRAQALEPKIALGYYYEGKARIGLADMQTGAFRNGSLREALFAFQQAKNADDPPADVAVFQAAILSDLASHAEAADALAEAAKNLPGKFAIVYLRAAELVKAEKFIEARAALTEAYAIDPGQNDLGPAMSFVLFRLGDVDGAARALTWQPGTPLPGVNVAAAPPPQK